MAAMAAMTALACGNEWHTEFHGYGDDVAYPEPGVSVDASRPDSGHRAAAPKVGPPDASDRDAQNDDGGDASDASQD